MIDTPKRITDLIEAHKAGADVHVEVFFEILSADFHHRANPFKAYIFLARYSGTVDGQTFGFRKCYARGCPNNLCTHVSLAVTIANRYLQRDYHALQSAGIRVGDTLFSLDDMVVKFENLQEGGPLAVTIPELTGLASSGQVVDVTVTLEYLSAVEHFANEKKDQTFLGGAFEAACEGKTYHSHRCFACFETNQETIEKPMAVEIANARLALVYGEFERAGIILQPQYFS